VPHALRPHGILGSATCSTGDRGVAMSALEIAPEVAQLAP